MLLLTHLLTSNVLAENGISLYPSVEKLDIHPGETREVNITVQNFESNNLKFTPELYLVNRDSKSIDRINTQPFAKWITFDKESLIIPSLQKENLTVSIKVPEGTPDISLNLAVIMKPEGADTQSNALGTVNSIGSNILLNVTNSTTPKQNVIVIKFKSETEFNLNNKVGLFSEIENSGNYFVRPRGYIDIYDPLGKKKTSNLKVNQAFEYLNPGEVLSEAHQADLSSEMFPLPGNYKAIIHIIDSETNQVLAEKEGYFFVMPFQYIIAIVLLLIILVIILFRIKKLKFTKSRNHEIPTQ